MITDEEIEAMWEELEENKKCSYVTEILKFARLIEQRAREEEREACAKVCEDEADSRRSGKPRLYEFGLLCAKLIRARGEP